MDAISPELALVDEELHRSARQRLPDATDCLTLAEQPAQAATPPQWRRLVVVVVLGVATLLALSGGSSVGTREHSLSSRQQDAPPPPARNAGHRLHWRPVSGAAFYNVIFWRNGERVLDLWPKTASVEVSREQLARGTYSWFVYPALGPADARRFGRVVDQGKLTI